MLSVQSTPGPQEMFFTQRRKDTKKKVSSLPSFFASLRLCVKYLAELPEQFRMDGGNRFRIEFGLAIVRKQSIDLLLDVRQLGVTKARQKLE
jgi:hypothetical protein